MKGCLKHCRVSPLTDEEFICGVTKLGGKPWLCNDCIKPESCILCNEDIKGFGNNAQPLAEGRCCDECNTKVIIERITTLKTTTEITDEQVEAMKEDKLACRLEDIRDQIEEGRNTE